jgi:hypothetical protein
VELTRHAHEGSVTSHVTCSVFMELSVRVHYVRTHHQEFQHTLSEHLASVLLVRILENSPCVNTMGVH